MKKIFKVFGVGALATLGLASAAVAEQSKAQQPAMSAEQNRTMMSQDGKGDDQMRGMKMNDPEMRKQMTEMMSNCNRMMKQMGGMSNMDMKSKS